MILERVLAFAVRLWPTSCAPVWQGYQFRDWGDGVGAIMAIS